MVGHRRGPATEVPSIVFSSSAASCGTPVLLDTSPHNLVPLVFAALLEGRNPHINGDDYPTPDGTCMCDDNHVADLALAHVVAAEKLAAGVDLRPADNLGSGDGVSVARIMTAMSEVTGVPFAPVVGPRRAGDRPGSSGRARSPRTSGGACATRRRTWCRGRGRPGATPRANRRRQPQPSSSRRSSSMPK